MSGAEGLATYFGGLDDGDIPRASSAFADGAFYIRQSMDERGVPTSELETIAGRDAIEAYFLARGQRPYRHTLLSSSRAGDEEYAEGVVLGGADGPNVTFIARATLDGQGRIARYFALASPISEAAALELQRTSNTAVAGGR